MWGVVLAVIGNILMAGMWIAQTTSSIKVKHSITPQWFWIGRILGAAMILVSAYMTGIWYLVLHPLSSFATSVANLFLRDQNVNEDRKGKSGNPKPSQSAQARLSEQDHNRLESPGKESS